MIEDIEIATGKYKLIYSKRLMLPSDEPIELLLKLDVSDRLLLKFSFTNSDNSKPSYKVEELKIDNGIGFHFILDKFNSPFGTGLINPVGILSHNVNGVNKAIVLTFFAYKNNEAHPILDMALYEEK